jgi:hypothetical protein
VAGPTPHSYEDGPLYRPTAGARPGHPSHPLAAERLPTPPTDEGGWLGPQPDHTSSAWPDPPAEPAQPRPFTDREVTAPSSGRRGGLMAVVIGVTLIATATAVLLFLNKTDEPAAQPGPSDSAGLPSVTVSPSLITAGTEGAPTDLRIESDTGATVMLVWTDPTGGEQSYVALQLATETEEPKHVTVAPGGDERTVTFSGLDPEENYCFTVGTVLAVNNVATADPVCTAR